MRNPIHLTFAFTVTSASLPLTSAFHELLPPIATLDAHTLIAQGQSVFDHATTIASTTTASPPLNPFNLYTTTLAAHPLPTKMMTGATLALTGDWIAQSRVPEEAYDKRRAASFAIFDSAYRASQHVLYPMVVATCQGQFLHSAFIDTSTAAALEQTLVSQLIIVPLLYYPVFYGVTSFVQGLTWEGTVDRAQQTFLPLMKRNLLFWIPVQFVQFSFLPENLQIPFLSVCGLCWTLILSVLAGSAKDYSSSGASDESKDEMEERVVVVQQEEPYCVTGMEGDCLIDNDDLIPHGSFSEITEEMMDIAHEVTHEWEEMTHRVMGDSDDDDIDDDDVNGARMNDREEEMALP